ncbi:MAG: FGGY family carbohydrate kinase [Thermoguttaceae bacterium]|nr:FGGY family carbohydrate kinase [Thermoguttaceae bacterium]
MAEYVLAFDLGTGGSRASLYDKNGECVGSVFEAVRTRYSRSEFHEQRPQSWWDAVALSSRTLLDMAGQVNQVAPQDVVAIAIGGHSLGTVPLDAEGNLLLEWTPIWSDGRGLKQAEEYFHIISYEQWYRRTGGGVPVGNYPLFKVLWLRENHPDLYAKIDKVLGTKDYVNYRMTGRIATDPSSAGSYGLWNLAQAAYDPELADAAEIPLSCFPEVIPSTSVLDGLTPEAASALGLLPGTKVIAGGVDNCCIALGARCFQEGRIAASLGSGSWLGRCGSVPQVNPEIGAFVYPHVVPGAFLSSFGVFSTGTAIRWVKKHMCHNFAETAKRVGRNPYFLMAEEARKSNIGANRLIFNPSMAGPSSSKDNPDIRGAFLGLSLRHTQADIIRATMEGIAMNMRYAFDRLKSLGPTSGPLVLAGEPLSELVRNIYLHVLNTEISTNYKSHAMPALGVAALAEVGIGLWDDFSPLDSINRDVECIDAPDPSCVERYETVYHVFKKSYDAIRLIANAWNDDIELEN